MLRGGRKGDGDGGDTPGDVHLVAGRKGDGEGGDTPSDVHLVAVSSCD